MSLPNHGHNSQPKEEIVTKKSCHLAGQSLAEETPFIANLLEDFPEVLCEKPGRTDLSQHSINTGESPPVRSPVYRLSADRRASLRKQLDEMLSDGRIEPSSSPWAAPVVMVPKKGGDYRLCIDCRKLNSVTTVDAYPMPTIESILESLHGATVFSSLDLKSGYHQMMVAPEDREKTAFICEDGLFQFTVLPFGVVNGPASFQRLMEKVLGSLIGKVCYVYLDDIVCFSENIPQHAHDLKLVLQALQEAGLTVNIDKCCFARTEMKYLGHIVSADGLKMDPEKIESIFNFPVPQNVKQLERFIGMVLWYSKFIPDFSTIAEPLNQLRRKKEPWKWTDECMMAFTQLKSVLTEEPILVYPDLDQPFSVHTDASNVGLGAVLLQERDGVLQTIAYASRSLNPTERNYSTTERECLAVVWALERWRVYLEGKRCKVVTDHQALCWLFNKAKLTGKLARWVLRLQDFSFDVEYRPGITHCVPDALSRIEEGVQANSIYTRDNTVDRPPHSIEGGDDKILPNTADDPEVLTNNDSVSTEPADSEACAASTCMHPSTDPIEWIQCDHCDKWYHQLCVHVKKRQAEKMPKYSCPPCRKILWENRK